MKFKAASSFRNTAKFKIDGRKEGDPHVEKGDTFEANLDDQNVAQTIAILGVSGRIIDSENQPVNAARIDAEVKAEKKKADELAKLATDGKK